jgi:hypothetical protein
MFGLGKKRTKFGKWMDKKRIKQIELEEAADLGRATISNMCNNVDYAPKYSTFTKVKKALEKWGYSVDYEDFWM